MDNSSGRATHAVGRVARPRRLGYTSLMQVEILDGLARVDAAAWNLLVGDASPFLEWGWLASLEESGCVAPASGWLPQHLVVADGGQWVGACPLYLKGHSDGEFVFDHGWAEAAERGGIAYYPKLLVAVPFTPATGARFLVHPDADRAAVASTLAAALTALCRRHELSSVHVNFCLPEEAALLSTLGFERRVGFQFQWHNAAGWRSFDDYLGALRSKRRNQVRREQRELAAQGIEIAALTGDEIPDAAFAPMFRLYLTTIDKLYWGQRYLNARLFDLLRQRWKHRLCFVLARRQGTLVAGTMNVIKGPTMYGRYWGAFEELRHLHFNVCYYAAIDFCLRRGLTRFEPGAGGSFKHLRGFDARPTESMHFVRDPRLAAAVRRFLATERDAVAHEVEARDARSAFRR